ncbi:unnamed protein product [Musa acuminata subsp. malaccensis]|uniref:(wild Malaysian banana) hypothetical protein n=1 Tax=Musa acuminata subsp. malaccensis TaxID=214687 RepID=A0A804L7U7_MUSAM|nr:unnamed protein product [Musa acuminata subsp. malaccensis]
MDGTLRLCIDYRQLNQRGEREGQQLQLGLQHLCFPQAGNRGEDVCGVGEKKRRGEEEGKEREEGDEREVAAARAAAPLFPAGGNRGELWGIRRGEEEEEEEKKKRL